MSNDSSSTKPHKELRNIVAYCTGIVAVFLVASVIAYTTVWSNVNEREIRILENGTRLVHYEVNNQAIDIAEQLLPAVYVSGAATFVLYVLMFGLDIYFETCQDCNHGRRRHFDKTTNKPFDECQILRCNCKAFKERK